jgi:hypothetical protein
LIETGAGRDDEYECELQLANVPHRGVFPWGVDLSAAITTAIDEASSELAVSLQGLDPRGVLRVRVPVNTDVDELARVLARSVEIVTQRHDHREQDVRGWNAHAVELRERYLRVIREAAPEPGVFVDATVAPELSPDGVRYLISLEVESPTSFELNLASQIFSGQGGYLARAVHHAGRIVFEDFPLEQEPRHALVNALRHSAQEIGRYRQLAAEAESRRQRFASVLDSKLGSLPQAHARSPSGRGEG